MTVQTYPAKILLWAPAPEELIAAGYDSLRLERRKSSSGSWATTNIDAITLEAGVYNYFFLDENAVRGWEYEPVLQNSVTPGTPADVRQGVYDAVDATFEKVLTVQQMKDLFLFGLDSALSNDQGVPMPDRIYVHNIQSAIAKFEQKVNVRVCPQRFVEMHDYFAADMTPFPFFQTDEYPLLSVESLEILYPGQDPLEVDNAWLKVQSQWGEIHVVPDGPGPEFFGYSRHFTYGGAKFHPNAYRLTYFAGMENPPQNIVDVIGKEASFGPLNLAGDLLGGAGIAQQSISLDGLSTNFATTSSATNAGFGARILAYQKELKDQHPELIRYYKGLKLRVM